MLKRSFKDSINFLTLRFKSNELEERYLDWKEEQMKDFTIPKLIIAITGLIMNILLAVSAYWYYSSSQFEEFTALLICIGVADIGMLIEWAIHCFKVIRYLRSITTSMTFYFAATYYSTTYLAIPGITPGYVFLVIHIEL